MPYLPNPQRPPHRCRARALAARRSIRHARFDDVKPLHHETAVHEVYRAWMDRDASRLATLLAPDVVALTDGGGVVPAGLVPVRGVTEVVDLLLTSSAKCSQVEIVEHPVNGHTGLVVRDEGRVIAIVSLNVRGRLVCDVWVVLNPDKLRRWNGG